MILIFSQNFEPSTDKVIEWLINLNKPFYRMNYDTDFIEAVYLELTDEVSEIPTTDGIKYDYNMYVKNFLLKLKNGVEIDLKKITSVWYRRGGMPDYNDFLVDFSVLKDKFFISKAKKYIRAEYTELIKFSYFFLFSNPRIKTLGSPYTSSSNKIIYLTFAKLFGLKIPELFIVSRKTELLHVFQKFNHKVTKGIAEMVMFAKDYFKLVSYTSNVDTPDLEKVEDLFFPSSIQRKILKLADIRIVFFNGNFYSMAIFSQNNVNTNTDFRNYDPVNPNRNTPFKLPTEIEDKLRNLLAHVKLNFCSIDILLDQDYDFYFLEINPVGQFGMVSMPCNYHIEKKIAEYL